MAWRAKYFAASAIAHGAIRDRARPLWRGTHWHRRSSGGFVGMVYGGSSATTRRHRNSAAAGAPSRRQAAPHSPPPAIWASLLLCARVLRLFGRDAKRSHSHDAPLLSLRGALATKQSRLSNSDWIASRSLSSGRPLPPSRSALRRTHTRRSSLSERRRVGPDPLARNDETSSRRGLAPELWQSGHVKREAWEQRRSRWWRLPWFFA
jgi:hypothetical protein